MVLCIALYRADRAVLPHPCNAANCECFANLGLQAVWCLSGGCPVLDRHNQVLLWHAGCPVCHDTARGATHQCTFQIGSTGQGKQEELGQVTHRSQASSAAVCVMMVPVLCCSILLPPMAHFSACCAHECL